MIIGVARRGLLLGSAVGAVNAAIAVAAIWWWDRGSGEFGWYSYSPMPRRYSDFIGSPLPHRHHWPAMLVIAAIFLCVNALAVALITRRWSAATSAERT